MRLTEDLAGRCACRRRAGRASHDLPFLLTGGESKERGEFALPDVPTVAESGLNGFEMVSWYGLWGPAQMPAELTRRIQNEVAKALASEKATKVLGEYGFVATASRQTDFIAYIRQEKARFSTLIKEANIRLD